MDMTPIKLLRAFYECSSNNFGYVEPVLIANEFTQRATYITVRTVMKKFELNS